MILIVEIIIISNGKSIKKELRFPDGENEVLAAVESTAKIMKNNGVEKTSLMDPHKTHIIVIKDETQTEKILVTVCKKIGKGGRSANLDKYVRNSIVKERYEESGKD